MKRIKIGLLCGAMMMSAVASGNSLDKLTDTVVEAGKSTMELLSSQKYGEKPMIDPLKDYDYDKNVPPSFDTLTDQVGKKDELEVFVPENSLLYYNFFVSAHKDAKKFREIYYGGIGKDDKDLTENPKSGRISSSTVKSMTFFKNGVLVKIDVAASPVTKLTLEDTKSKYSVAYTYGHGYVVKADLMTKLKDDKDHKELKYVLTEYKTAIDKKGYSYESIFGRFYDEPAFEKDDSIVKITSEIMSLTMVVLFGEREDFAIMSFYSKETYNDHDKIMADINKKDYDKNYKKLDYLLNN